MGFLFPVPLTYRVHVIIVIAKRGEGGTIIFDTVCRIHDCNRRSVCTAVSTLKA